jgi:DNA-binding NarL/FixJ family response regulator
LRCLIVDDNAGFLAAARTILEGRDYTIIGEATSAAEALQRLEEVEPDLVLLDIDLGNDNGFSVARQLVARTGDARPKLILISAHPGDDFADLIAESPVLGFIPKSELSPGAIDELLSSA